MPRPHLRRITSSGSGTTAAPKAAIATEAVIRPKGAPATIATTPSKLSAVASPASNFIRLSAYSNAVEP